MLHLPYGSSLSVLTRCLCCARNCTRQAWQRVIAAALLCSTLVNVGTVLSVSALGAQATAAFVGAGLLALQVGWDAVTVLEHHI